MSKQQLRDNIIVTQRNGVRIPYVLRLCRVMESDADDKPTILRVMKKDTIVHLEGGERFVTAYMPFEVCGDDI